MRPSPAGKYSKEAQQSDAWPFVEARKLLKRQATRQQETDCVLFETGYGPSGLPHIGTFGEVARTSMVRRAFSEICDIPSKLICFSDDLDGMRAIPDNIPKSPELEAALGLPLSQVPCPFGEYASFAEGNNARLQAFLDSFGLDYEFMSATECYQSGRFDKTLLLALARFEDIMSILLPTLSPERRLTYSPFMPISPETGRVLQVATLERDLDKGTILFEDEDGKQKEIPVTGGACKLQWKADWACRWVSFAIDYEMSGKDLIDSVKDSGKICRVLGGRIPEGFSYEHFLDGGGHKISKSKGNGLSVEEWLSYADPHSLAYFMYQKPRSAKRLHFDVIPKSTDEYYKHMADFPGQTNEAKLSNPVWHVHGGQVPQIEMPITFTMLMNLATAAGAKDAQTLWGFIGRYVPEATPSGNPELNRSVHYAVRYYIERVKPTLRRRMPTAKEAQALASLRSALGNADSQDAQYLQNIVYKIGKQHSFEPLRQWFTTLYETLLGQQQGPRFGSFIALYGVQETINLIDDALSAHGQ